MDFQLEQAIPVLERTPAALRALLLGLPDAWLLNNEGGDSWSPFDVVGHVLHLEADWMGRAHIIMEHGTAVPFNPVDRFAMFEKSKGKTIGQLLDEFAATRAASVLELRTFTADDLGRKGFHPALGEVEMRHFLSAWVVHDLNHLHQIAQTMSRQYREEVGSWREYLAILDD